MFEFGAADAPGTAHDEGGAHFLLLTDLAYAGFAELGFVLMTMQHEVKSELLKLALEHSGVANDRDIEIYVAAVAGHDIFWKWV